MVCMLPVFLRFNFCLVAYLLLLRGFVAFFVLLFCFLQATWNMPYIRGAYDLPKVGRLRKDAQHLRPPRVGGAREIPP